MSVPYSRRSWASVAFITAQSLACGYFILHLVARPFETIFAVSSDSSAAAQPPPAYHGYTSNFSFNVDQAVHPDWMSHIPDSTPLNSLSIPGTHDTMTFDLVDTDVYQCQMHDLATQLRAGVRYLDIRGRLLVKATNPDDGPDKKQAPVIGIFHGHVPTGYTMQDVLLTVFEFLDENPSEGIVMRIKEEGAPVPVGSPEDTWTTGKDNTTFEEAFNYYRQDDPLTSAGSDKHFLLPWKPDGRVLPTVAELRSKVIVLQEFPSVAGNYGIPWTSDHIKLEDLWIIMDPEKLEDKWEAVRTNLEAAAASAEDSDFLYLSHLSASVGVLPIEAAAGPLRDVNGTSIVGINDRTGQWLGEGEARGEKAKTGIVMGDFPGLRLVEKILKRNDWLAKDRR